MSGDLADVEAITFDFANTLVPVGRAALQRVVETTADRVAARLGSMDRDEFLEAWVQERERQFREEVPRFREVDIAQRVVRVLARLRGIDPPQPEQPWDDIGAALHSSPEEVGLALEVYSSAFVEAMPAPASTTGLLARLAGRYDLAVLSNWPLAATIDRLVEANGWAPFLCAVIVSQRVGSIKPHPAIFEAAREALGGRPGSSILHVGDDWAADVVGAAQAGWRTAWLDDRPVDSPLPSSMPDGSVMPDLVLHRLADLEVGLAAHRDEPVTRPR